jgi:hypothetical protein
VEIDWSAKTRPQMAVHSEALSFLGRLLAEGQLCLLLGAGVSKPMGLPLFKDLVTRCFQFANLPAPGDSGFKGPTEELAKTAEVLTSRYSGDIPDLVRKGLYAGLFGADEGEVPSEYPVSASTNPMLAALGALTMASGRGSTAEVVTMNFDDLLEWYLDLHGFSTHVVSEMPTLVRDSTDVRVFHLHGFLPLSSRYQPSERRILSHSELRARNAAEDSTAWKSFLLSRLHTKVFLAVGTRLEDEDLHLAAEKVRREIGTSRPFGFVLDVFDGDSSDRLFREGFVPVGFGSYDDIPGFILQVCQSAVKYRR